MKLPCAVTRDLLPLYAENMVEQETKALIEEHLNECADCREKLSAMNAPPEKPVDTVRPLQNLKKQIRKKRLYAAALAALGYAPEDWAGLASCRVDGTPLEPRLLREAVTGLDPATVVVLDDDAANAFREAYADELAALPSFDEAMLTEGLVSHVLGMRVLNVGNFEDSLASDAEKQRSWAYLKRIPPMGEPY